MKMPHRPCRLSSSSLFTIAAAATITVATAASATAAAATTSEEEFLAQRARHSQQASPDAAAAAYTNPQSAAASAAASRKRQGRLSRRVLSWGTTVHGWAVSLGLTREQDDGGGAALLTGLDARLRSDDDAAVPHDDAEAEEADVHSGTLWSDGLSGLLSGGGGGGGSASAARSKLRAKKPANTTRTVAGGAADADAAAAKKKKKKQRLAKLRSSGVYGKGASRAGHGESEPHVVAGPAAAASANGRGGVEGLGRRRKGLTAEEAAEAARLDARVRAVRGRSAEALQAEARVVNRFAGGHEDQNILVHHAIMDTRQGGGRLYCDGGKLFYLANSTFRCPGYDGVVFPPEHVSDKADCLATDVSTVRCVCPMDMVPRFDGGVMVCDQPLPLRCSVRFTAPSPEGCAQRRASGEAGHETHPTDYLKPCHFYKSSDSVDVNMTLTCRMQPGVDLRDTYPNLNPDVTKVLTRYSDSTMLVYDTLREIQRKYFTYSAAGAGFPGFSTNHWILFNTVTFRLVNFNRLGGQDGFVVDVPVSKLSSGQITGEKPFVYPIDFATLPPAFFQGGRVFAEGGLLFSPNHTASIVFDFVDYNPAEATGSAGSSRGVVALLIVLSVLLCLAACGMWLYVKTRKKSVKSD